MMMMPISSETVAATVLENMVIYGTESIEVEFRLGKVRETEYRSIKKNVEGSKHFSPLGKTITREEFNGTDARKVYRIDNNQHASAPMTLYKKRLQTHDLDGGIRLGIALERPGEPNTEREYTMYRVKERESFVFDNVWRVDFTEVETNDPRYSDSDEKLYEIEVELLNRSDMLYYYTMKHLIDTGYQLVQLITS